MFGAIVKATHSSFQKGKLFCLSIYMKKVIALLAFIFEKPSYCSLKSQKYFLQQIRCSSIDFFASQNSLLFMDSRAYIFISN